MAVTTGDIYGAAIEKVSPKLQMYFEQTDQIAGLVKKSSQVETIGRRLYRFAAMQFVGGTYQKFNPNSGDMGAGSGMKLGSFVAGYVNTNYVVEMSEDSIETSDKAGQSVVNVFATQLAKGMDELKAMDDINFHTDGTGKLTSTSSATGSWGSSLTTYTFANTTDYIGINKLREGLYVSVWDSAGSTLRTSGAQIDHIDYNNKVVYLNSTVSGASSGDLLAIAQAESGVLGASLASFSSTWPGTPGTAGVLTGDSFRHGLFYANDATTSNYFLQTQKSANTQLIPANYTANASLTFQMVQLCLDNLLKRRNPEVLNGLVGVSSFAQRSAYQTLGINVTNWMRTKTEEPGIDQMPNNNGYANTFQMCGVTTYISKRQHNDRLDFFNPKTWGRAQLHDTKFHERGGVKIFESRMSSGNLKAAWQFIIKQAYDFVPFDPGSGAYISSLSVPTGY